MPGPLQDLTGRTFGLWKVLHIADRRKGKVRWTCLCTGCNTQHIVFANSLRCKTAHQSKGCRKCRAARLSNPVGRRYGDLEVIAQAGTYVNPREGTPRQLLTCLCHRCSKQLEIKLATLTAGKRTACWDCQPHSHRTKPGARRTFTSAHCAYRHSAKQRGHAFELSLEQFTALVTSNCFYCGDPPGRTQESISRGRVLRTTKMSGIDRFINAEGYTVSNCVPCCWPCNQMKSNMDGPDFLNHIKKIATKHPDAPCHGDVLAEIADSQ